MNSNNWISVKDRLPDIDVNVLTFPYSMVTIRHLKEDNVWFFDALPVTHWQYLPAAPSEIKQTNE